MKRKILFRGFHPDENGNTVITLNGMKIRGEWVFGHLIDGADITLIVPQNNEFSFCEEENLAMDLIAVDVIPETVGQWVTTDKNGKDVFENDIVKCQFHDEKFVGFIEWQSQTACYLLYNGEGDWLPLDATDDEITLEKVGNIYDNWELLESIQ